MIQKRKKRRQKSKGGFKTKQEAIASATTLVHGLNMGTYMFYSRTLPKNG
ncbi:Arm DNA-binding domain-containing protein [Siminovitchia terrae]